MANSNTFNQIRFRGKLYITDATPENRHGFIATRQQYENGTLNYAHLYPSGVSRFGKRIGTADEVEFTGKAVAVKPKPGAWFKVLDRFLGRVP